MEAALAEVLTDPVFVRSPTLSRLVKYLVEATIRGQGKILKSYTVAVDGLGKSPDFDLQADTYARVVAVRLRKALDAHYSGIGAQQSERLWIESGTYEVRLVPNGQSGQQPPAEPQARGAWQSRRQMVIFAGIAVCVILIISTIVLWRAESEAATKRWRYSNFPAIDVSVHDLSGDNAESNLTRQMQKTIMLNLGHYEGVRVIDGGKIRPQYSVSVELMSLSNEYIKRIMVIDRSINRVVWSHEWKYKLHHNKKIINNDELIKDATFRIARPNGIMHTYERRRVYTAGTPYGCWLQFSQMLDNDLSIDDRNLTDCAQDWYSAAPNHPLAAALYGWTLTDKSVSRLTDSGRADVIAKAVDVLESARAMNPASPTLQTAAMRAYAFAGDDVAARFAAEQALKFNPDNLDIQGAVGMTLALQNDPQGEVLLNKAIAEHFNAPAWYFVGTFVSAMMRDDPISAGKSLTRIRALHHSLPILPILSAAFHARTGNLEKARADWSEATAKRPILGIMPDKFLSRLPMSPPVRARLKQWLAPVLGKTF